MTSCIFPAPLDSRRILSKGNARLSVSFGEPVSSSTLGKIWGELAATFPGFRKNSIERRSSVPSIKHDESLEFPFFELDWSSLAQRELATQWAHLVSPETPLSQQPEVTMASAHTILLPDGMTHLLISCPDFLLTEDEWFFLLCEILERLEGKLPPSFPSQPELSHEAPWDFNWWSDLAIRGPSPQLENPLHPRRPGTPAWQTLILDRERTKKFKESCRRLNIPPSSALFALWAIQICRKTCCREILFLASPPELAEPNPLPVKFSLEPKNPLSAILKNFAEQERMRAQFTHGCSLANLRWPNDKAILPSDFTGLFEFKPPSLNERVADVFPRWINIDARVLAEPPHNLTLEVRDGIRFNFRLHSALLDDFLSQEILSELEDLTKIFTENPDSFPAEVASRILDSFKSQSSETVVPPAPIQDVISDVASRIPEQPAVQAPTGDVLTYRELDSAVSRFAGLLVQNNLANGWTIGLCLSPSKWIPIGLLGILRAGSICLPFDPSCSLDWIASLLSGSDCELIVCDSGTAPMLEGLAQRLLVIDQVGNLEIPEPCPISTHETNNTALLLPGTDSLPRPPCHIFSSKFLSACALQSARILELTVGDRIAINAPLGSPALLEGILSALASGSTALLVGTDADPLAPSIGATHVTFSSESFRSWISQAILQGGAQISENLKTASIDLAESFLPVSTCLAWHALSSGVPLRVFTSPCGFAGVSLTTVLKASDVSALAETYYSRIVPLGRPSASSGCKLIDPLGLQPKEGFPGQLHFHPVCGEPIDTSWLSWRTKDGLFHLVPDASQRLAIQALSHDGVLDAVADATGKDGVWVVSQPGAQLPQGASSVTQIPLRHGRFIIPYPGVEQPFKTDHPSQVGTQIEDQRLPSSKKLESESATDSGKSDFCPYSNSDHQPSLITFLDKSQNSQPIAVNLQAEWSPLFIDFNKRDNPVRFAQKWTNLISAHNPVHLVGVGQAGLVAFELARILRSRGISADYLVLIGTEPPQQSNLPRYLKKFFDRSWIPRELLYTPEILHGPCGIIITKDLSECAINSWRKLAPQSTIQKTSLSLSDLLGSFAHELPVLLQALTEP